MSSLKDLSTGNLGICSEDKANLDPGEPVVSHSSWPGMCPADMLPVVLCVCIC